MKLCRAFLLSFFLSCSLYSMKDDLWLPLWSDKMIHMIHKDRAEELALWLKTAHKSWQKNEDRLRMPWDHIVDIFMSLDSYL